MLKKVPYLLAIFNLLPEGAVFIPLGKEIRDGIPIVELEGGFYNGLKFFEFLDIFFCVCQRKSASFQREFMKILYIQSQIKTRYKPCNLKEKSV
jgi:hypothetical protein